MFDLLRFLHDHNIGYKQTTVDGMQVKADCPKCDGYEKLWLTLNKDLFWCHKCQWSPDLEDLIEGLTGKHGAAFLQAFREYKAIPSADDFDEYVLAQLETVPESFTRMKAGQPVKRGGDLEWPAHYRPLGDPDIVGVNRYALGRGIPWDVMQDHQFGGCVFGKYSGRLVLPVLERGKLVFWQARDTTGNSTLRYLTPPGYSGAACLFNIDKAATFDPVIICEGVFSALKAGPDAVATFGNKISVPQVELLRERGVRNVVLCHDPDSWSVPAPVARRSPKAKPPIYTAAMRLLGRFDDVRVACLEGGDPDEIGTERTRQFIDRAKLVDSREQMAALTEFRI